MKKFLLGAIAIAIVGVAIASFMANRSTKPPVSHASMLPWQIEILANGSSRVFGLVLTGSRLSDARRRFGEDAEIGIIAARGEQGSLEAYFNSVTVGGISGKMILVGSLDETTLRQLRARCIRKVYMDQTTYRYVLNADDLSVAWRAPIAAITFIPSAHIGADTVLRRFGRPQERLRMRDQAEHFLYPRQGLDLALDSKGKAILQYVAPRDFARLREPLRQRTTSAPSSDN